MVCCCLVGWLVGLAEKKNERIFGGRISENPQHVKFGRWIASPMGVGKKRIFCRATTFILDVGIAKRHI